MLIRFLHIGMRYGLSPEVLTDVSFSITEGSFYYLTGASGAGKTSLLRLMYLAHRPSRGVMHMFGEDLSRLSRQDRARLRRRIGVVFQDFRLINHLSVFDNVALPLRLRREDESVIRRNVLELLDWSGLARQKDALPMTLSGGQQQRVAISRAVVSGPPLLIADEPTGNVDDETARRLLYLFEEMNKHGTTVFVATHNTKLIESFPHPVLSIEKGRVQLGRSA